ncbi:YchJ family protein [Ancylomarina sp. DW003]|nr:YchJ family protein [Ancylomarina sp. DW003]MDE5422617.1 YchJ family protein [Ancylomarina sp. DW003]
MKNCICGRPLTYEDCCGVYHSGKRVAQTAEDLMRSRYSAFVLADVDYIMRTYATETRPNSERNEIKEWAASVMWLGLQIISTKDGTIGDSEGRVKFKALYSEAGKIHEMIEDSFFRFEKGQWFYVNGR